MRLVRSPGTAAQGDQDANTIQIWDHLISHCLYGQHVGGTRLVGLLRTLTAFRAYQEAGSISYF